MLYVITHSSLHISIKKGELVAVVGRVGCGKSSLLASMIGELTKLSGSVDVQVCNNLKKNKKETNTTV